METEEKNWFRDRLVVEIESAKAGRWQHAWHAGGTARGSV